MRLKATLRPGESVYTPLIPVQLRFPGDPADLLALIDSGADATIFSAENLPSKVRYEDLTVLGMGMGVGGTFEIRRCDVEVWFLKWKICDHIQVIEPGKSPTPMALLGRDDFFRRFTVYFDWSRMPGEFEIRRKPR